jgi:hypothetical protein
MNLPTDITTREEGEAVLALLKQDLLQGVRLTEVGLLQQAIALYKIRQSGVWIYDVDESGEPWDTPGRIWSDYVVWLSRSMDFKRTMLREGMSAITILAWLGFTESDILSSAIDLRPVIEIKRHLDYHNRTGEVRGVKNEFLLETLPPGDTLDDRLRSFVLETHDLPNPEERMKRVNEVLGVGDEIIHFVEIENDIAYAGWVFNNVKGYWVDDQVPVPVLKDYCKRLGAAYPLEG